MNNDQGSLGADAKAGIVQNNFCPAELGNNAVDSGAGSSGSESAEAVKNNSSYNADGTLTTAVKDSSGNEMKNLGDAIDQVVIGGEGGTNVPEVLKVTVTYNHGGYGTAPEKQTVSMGSTAGRCLRAS